MADDAPDPAEASWHLDKRIPVALLLGVLGQGAVGIWWMSSLQSRVAHLETSVPALAASDAETAKDVRAIGLQIARLEERVAARQRDAALMPAALLAPLLASGCQATLIEGRGGPAAVVLICPPPVSAPAATPGPEERQG